jgi:chromate reductase, NAD(P)H dehydrogenase (quinone)
VSLPVTIAHLHVMKILAISGSLRAQSTNTILLRAATFIAPPSIQVLLYEELETIPAFNPDLDVEPGPASVLRWRAALRDADAVLFSTPEYAHGVPGALKNALDWVVGSGELSGRSVALFNASARGEYAQASLREILKTMDARLLSDAEVTVSLLGKDLTPSEVAANPQFADPVLAALKRIEQIEKEKAGATK